MKPSKTTALPSTVSLVASPFTESTLVHGTRLAGGGDQGHAAIDHCGEKDSVRTSLDKTVSLDVPVFVTIAPCGHFITLAIVNTFAMFSTSAPVFS
jgi:hypothetical protein